MPKSIPGWRLAAVALAVLPALALQATSVPMGAPTAPAGLLPGAASNPNPLDGPWGELELTPIVISPPLEFLPRNLVAARAPTWSFPDTTERNVGGFLTAAGIDPEVVQRILATARPLGESAGIVVSPAADLVRGLEPKARARIYLELSKSPLNSAQDFAFRFFGKNADEWLRGALISDRTRQIVEPLIYREGNFLFFADFDLVRPQITDPDELQRLHKVLLRQKTYVVRQRVDKSNNLPQIVEYWGRGGRRTDIRPLLESVAEGGAGAALDISHLLPTFARQYLYRYPRTTPADLEKPLLANCLWTALNFFSTEPDNRYLSVDVALAALKRDYYFVYDNYQLGDIVALADSNGNLFHAAVYLAAGLIFGKNGSSALAPWSILPIEHLEGFYAEEKVRGWQVSYLRRKDL
jgi:hypothetical protein